ncbi:dihydropteroate synthase [Rhodospirillum centenum]|uniref:dihydropteroate synthase n=1 Tax=Rhodospirillum centenum (strain ATCC 51521 / SW) TaxID=414684 RepID=B6ITH4_RHOCS|nr:dihydropteroate synthase [Rhodospirillum centenum]ACI99192.1 dihydropteroate synthase [Rhodospirillum centenum SW]
MTSTVPMTVPGAVPTLALLPPPVRPADLYLRPTAFLSGAEADRAVAAGQALRLAGSGFAFALLEVAVRTPEGSVRAIAPADAVRDWMAGLEPAAARRAAVLLAALTTPPLTVGEPAWAGLGLGRPLIQGIVNVTPDSFSDGGDHADSAAAVAHGRALLEAGADILDVGGESTRPGAQPVDPAEEAARVVPVIRALAEAGAVVSVDTRRASVMRSALAAGARIVNDITALAGDPDSLTVAAAAGCPVVLMHMQGEPGTMQQDPQYRDVVLDVFDGLEERLLAAEAAGIPRHRIAVDPGIGFGKTVEHNLALLRQVGIFHALGCPVLVGLSRKRFIASLSRGEEPKQRLPGSLAAGLATLSQGVQILRVHDVAETWQARAVWGSIGL